MATLISGLGGTAGYGENAFSTLGAPPRTGNLDDGSINVNLSTVFGSNGLNLYGTPYTSVFINTNGLLTFGTAEPGYTSAALTTLNQPTIAPFWTDIDISKGGQIYWDLDPATGRFIVTWLNVAPYTGAAGVTNSFQAVLTNLGGGDFNVEFIYGSIGFVNGGYGNATVGVSNGTSTQTLVEGSGDAAFLATYAGNEFDTQDPAGVWSMSYEGGQPFFGDGVVEGTAGNDLIDLAYVGDPEQDRIDGLDGTGFGGTTGQADYVLAGLGNDTVISGLGDDIIYGGSGNDQITSAQGNDWVDGGSENDSVDGGSGSDSLYGGSGDDTLTGGADSTATIFTPSYTEVTTATQAITGTGGRPNFTIRSISNETLTTGTNGTPTWFNLGDADSTETHTHTASSQISGGQIRFNGLSGTETLTITIDGVVQNLNTALANGTVSFNGVATYQINAAGQIIRTGSGATSANIGTLTINVPYTTVALASTGTTTSPGLWYEYYVNTQPNNIAAGVGGNDLLSGGDGNDVADGGSGNDTLQGDAGNDQLLGNDGNDSVYGGTGNDTVSGGLGEDLLDGGADNDSITGGTGNDTLLGDVGDDTLSGDDGNDSLSGGLGNDSLSGGLGVDTLVGGDGNDTLNGGDDADSLTGDLGDDLLNGDAGADTLSGGDGNDALYGGSENDTLFGDAGNDQLFGGIGQDSLAAGVGNDTAYGGDGNDTISTDVGNDLIFGGEGNDNIQAGAGNDTIIGDLGNDTINADQGMDWVDYSGSNAGVTVDLITGTGAGGHAAGDVYNGVDAIIGSGFDDVLSGFDGFSTNPGDAYTNIFYGNAGNDSLDGRGGDDSLYGGADNDTVQGGSGADLVDGGTGSDSLLGGSGNDTVLGGDGNDILIGGAGADSLDGGTGNETIVVTTGTDSFGDTVAGGENTGDNDVLDLTAWGWSLTNINYDPNNAENGTVEFLDSTGAVIGSMSFSGIETVIPCFTPGTLIATDKGDVLVEDLKVGDKVFTRDNGWQVLRWVGQRKVSLADMIIAPALRPIEIAKGALGNGLPLRSMKVSPQHRMLIESARSEMLFGEAEVLVAATHLTGLAGVEQKLTSEVTYIHLLFDRHEIICAEGAWTESFQPAMRMLNGMDDAQRTEITTLFPELATSDLDFPAARLSLKAHEAKVLLAA
jgi:Ca2+-binding RTX toxin-like protein